MQPPQQLGCASWIMSSWLAIVGRESVHEAGECTIHPGRSQGVEVKRLAPPEMCYQPNLIHEVRQPELFGPRRLVDLEFQICCLLETLPARRGTAINLV